MAKLIIDNVPQEIPDGQGIAEMCEKSGVPFSCNSGVCGTCQIQVLEGQENLGPLKQEEIDLGMDGRFRLACRCEILRGTVKVKY